MSEGAMTGEVVLHVYDVTNSESGRTNATIRRLNKILRDGMGIGGIFHGAIQVYNEEWSFGYCENGTGVFCCPPAMNPMYTHRESIVLGHILLSRRHTGQILLELSQEWNGSSYDLLSRNCNHFCDALCEQLGVQKLPLWVNRFANAGEAAVEAAGNTMEKLRQAKADMVTASRIARHFLFSSCTTSTSAVTPDPWLRNMATSSRNSQRIGFSRNPLQQRLRNQSSSSGMDKQTEDNRLVKQCRNSSSCFLRCICAGCSIRPPSP